MLQENNMGRRKNTDTEYVVEKILSRRFVHGELQYLVRWEGFTSEDDTWEPVEHLTKCASRIEAYEQSLQREEARKDAAQSSKARDKRNKRNPEAEDAIGAKRIKVSNIKSQTTVDGTLKTDPLEGKEAVKIHCASNEFEDILFLVEFADEDLAMVYGEVVRERWPALLIAFYEKYRELVPFSTRQ